MIQAAIKEAKEKVIGLRQTLRAAQKNKIERIYYASDVDDFILRKITEVSLEKDVEIIPTGLNQKELGKVCQIEVGTAVVAVLK